MSNPKTPTRRFVLTALVAATVAGTGLLGTTAAFADGPHTPPRSGQTQVIQDGAIMDSEYNSIAGTPRGLPAGNNGRGFVDAAGGVLLSPGNVVVVTGDEDNFRPVGTAQRPMPAQSAVGDEAAYPTLRR